MTLTLIKHRFSLSTWYMVEGRDCSISIEERPAYCDRGNWIAKLHPHNSFEFDSQDGWPRYFFDFDRMLAEVEAWLVKRGQMPESDPVSMSAGGERPAS